MILQFHYRPRHTDIQPVAPTLVQVFRVILLTRLQRVQELIRFYILQRMDVCRQTQSLRL